MKTTDLTLAGPAAVESVVEQVVAAFEAAHAAGGPADPAAFAPPAGSPAHLPAARELIRADLEFGWRAGRRPRVEDYRAGFPAVFADPASLREVAFEEFRQRLARGESPASADYAARLGVDVTGWAAGSRRTPTELKASAGRRSFAAPPPDRFPEPGEEYLGFRLVRELGRGAFARVYLAEQPELAGRWVALKVSTQHAGESQTLARLQHPNIVPVYSVHRAGRYHAVCMPFFGSATLADVLTALRAQPFLPASGAGFVSTVNQHKDPTVGPAEADPGVIEPAGRPAVGRDQSEQQQGGEQGVAGIRLDRDRVPDVVVGERHQPDARGDTRRRQHPPAQRHRGQQRRAPGHERWQPPAELYVAAGDGHQLEQEQVQRRGGDGVIQRAEQCEPVLGQDVGQQHRLVVPDGAVGGVVPPAEQEADQHGGAGQPVSRHQLAPRSPPVATGGR